MNRDAYIQKMSQVIREARGRLKPGEGKGGTEVARVATATSCGADTPPYLPSPDSSVDRRTRSGISSDL